MSLLQASGLSLQFGAPFVLDDVSATFAHGRVTVLLGPNGAGKSSLLACLAGLRTPSAGSVTLDGRAVAGMASRERARRIGFLPQSPDVHWDVDVRSLVALGRFPHRGRWGESAADRGAIDRAMLETDVAALAERPVGQLSGGERGRVLIARVLAGEPQWLLVDEPLASLDPAHQLDTLELLRDAAGQGRGVIVVLHDLHLAYRIAQDVVLLRSGRVIAAGPADDMLTPKLLGDTYDIAVEVGRTGQGQRFILPVGRS